MQTLEHTFNASSTDIIIALVLLLICIFGFYRGKATLCAIIVAFYPAILMYKMFPYTESFVLFKQNSNQVFFSHLLVFAIFFVFTFFVTRSITHSNYTRGGIIGIIDAFLLGLSVVALSLVVLFHVLPPSNVYDISSAFFNIFRSDVPAFLAIFLPIGLLKYLA